MNYFRVRSYGTNFFRRSSARTVFGVPGFCFQFLNSPRSEDFTEFLFKQFGSEPKGQMKEYFQLIHRLYPKIGLIEPSRDFKYLGIYTSHKKPSASGTWFMLHYLSVKEMFK